MGRTLPLATALVVALGGGATLLDCTAVNADYCDLQDRPCKSTARPFCDIEGRFPAANGVNNVCIPDPHATDAQIDLGPRDAGTDADGPDANRDTRLDLASDARLDARADTQVDDPNLLFQLFGAPSSLHNLPRALGTPQEGGPFEPAVQLHAASATLVRWEARDGLTSLELSGTGPVPTLDWGAPLLGKDDTSVRFHRGRYYRSVQALPVAGARPIIELVFWVPSQLPANETLLGVGLTEPDHPGFRAGLDAQARLTFAIGQTAASEVQVVSSVLTAGAWYHALIFASPEGIAAIYINGSLSGTTANLSAVPQLEGAPQQLTLGGQDGSASVASGAAIAAASLWLEGGDLLLGRQAQIARRRFHQLTGIYPQKATGTALAKVAHRNSPATLDKVEADGTRRLYIVGRDWLRVASRPDGRGGKFWGYLAETERTNYEPYSAQLEQGTLEGVSVTVDTHLAPDGTRTADTIREEGAQAQHRLGGPGITVTAGELYAYSIFLKPLARSSAALLTGNGPVADARADFDLKGGRIRATSLPDVVGATITPYHNGFYRCVLYFRAAQSGGVGIWTIVLNEDSEPDGNTAQSQDAIIAWGRQAEAAVTVATTYVATGDALVTRAADELTFVGDDGNINALRGQLQLQALVENPGGFVLAQLSDDSLDDVHEVAVSHLTLAYQAKRAAVALWDLQAPSAPAGAPETAPRTIGLSASWQAGEQLLLVDGARATSRASAVPEAPLSSIHVGLTQPSSGQTNALVRDVRSSDVRSSDVRRTAE